MVFTHLFLSGFWQLDRLKWKTDIIEKIDIQENIDPMNVQLDLSDNTPFQRGYIDAQHGDSYLFKISPEHMMVKLAIM